MAHVKYSKALMQRAARHQLRKTLGARYWISIMLLVAAGAVTWVSGQNIWLVYVIGSILLQAFLVPLLALRLRAKDSLVRIWSFGTSEAAIDIQSGRFRAHSAFGSVDLPLSRITSVTCTEDYWLLHSGRSTTMVLPTAEVPWPTTDSWLNELRQAGAKVA
jgi:membrane protein YdbS with pleckstrin-like domain